MSQGFQRLAAASHAFGTRYAVGEALIAAEFGSAIDPSEMHRYAGNVSPNYTAVNVDAVYAAFVLAVRRYRTNGNTGELRDTMRRLIVRGLHFEELADKVIATMMAAARPGNLSDSKFDKLNIRQMLKLIGIGPICLLAGSLCYEGVAKLLLLDYADSSGWTQFCNEVGYSFTTHAERMEMWLLEHEGKTALTDADLEAISNRWNGSTSPTTITATIGAPQPAFDATAFATPYQPATTATTGVIMSNATPIASATANIVNAVLNQVGISDSIEVLLERSSSLAGYAEAAQSYKDEAEKLAEIVAAKDRQIEMERQRAAAAVPSTVTLTSQSSTIPNGTMKKIDAASAFPELSGLHLEIPSFEWDGDHPDVPKANAAYIFRKGMLISVLRCLANGDNTWLQGHTGSGKCLAAGTEVLMFNGSTKKVEDIVAGDLVMGPDSMPRRVEGTCSGTEEMFRVTPTKGESYVVNRSHILSLRMTGGSKNACGYEDGSVVNMSIDEYLSQSINFKHCAKGWRTGVDFLQQVDALEMEPYFLGLWLGDGSSANSGVWSADQEIKSYLYHYAARLGLSYKEEQKNELSGLSLSQIVKTGGSKHAHPLRDALRHYKLIGNKHIPHAFKTASREDRLQLLAGVIDTDGSLSNGCYELTLKSEQLFDDVLFLARSLGFAAYKQPAIKTSQHGTSGLYFRCHISGDLDQIPCKIARKIAAERGQKKNVLNTGITVASEGVGQYFGFELSGSDHLFLLGDFTVTHNTTFIEQVASRLGWPVARVAYDSNVDRAELVGRMQLTPDGKGGTESKWLPGILERAISGGYILLCDEMDAGHPNALYTLQPLLEGKGLTLLEDGGRMIPRHPFSRIVATGNTTGNGDPSGLYPACRILSAATLDRFQDFVQVPYLTESEETNLIKSQAPGLKAATVEKIVKFGSELRKAFTSGETPISFSPRRSVAFARHVEDLQAIGIKSEALCISIAFRSKLYDAAPEEHRQRLLEIGKAKLVDLDVDAALLDA